MNILKPNKLHEGDIIGIVATSFAFPIDEKSEYYQQYNKGVNEIESLGFKIKEGKNLRKVEWWRAGTPEERAGDINSMFADPEVKAIIVHDGGQSAISILEHVDYELIAKNPKPFIGFSDITNLHCAMFTKTGLVGFQGPLLTYSLGRVWNEYLSDKKEEGKQLFKKILTSSDSLDDIKPLSKWECLREGKAEGMVFGGNLSMLSSLVGTQYFPTLETLKGSILFWETDNTASYRIERGLYQLKYSGLLEVISGMVIGKLPDIKPTSWDGFNEPTPKEIIMSVLKNYDFPILGEFDFGHKTVTVPVPIGIRTFLDATNLKVKYLESAIK